MMRTPVRTAKPVMSFEEAMTQALNRNTDTNPITKWDVEVYFRVPFEGQSAYKADYKPISVEQLLAAGVPANPMYDSLAEPVPRVPFEGCSTSHADYKAHPINPNLQQQYPSELPQTPHVPFTGESTYKSTYVKPDLSNPNHQHQYPAEMPQAPHVPFTGESHYKSTYVKPDLSNPNHQHQYPAEMPQAPHVPFTGESHYKSTYVKPDLSNPNLQHQYPAELLQTPHVPFMGESHYKSTYVKPDLSQISTPGQPRFGSDTSSDYGPPRVPFEGTTTASESYRAPPASAYQRDMGTPGSVPNSGNPGVRFEGRTTNQETYIRHPLPEREMAETAMPMDPQFYKDDRDFVTTSKDTFKAPPQVFNDSIHLMQDRQGRLRVYVDRNASVADLQKVLEDYTCIPMPAQHIVRRQDNMVLEQHEHAKLISELHWTSGEEVVLTDKEREVQKH